MKATILHITDQLIIGGTEILLKNTLPLLTSYDHVVVFLGGDETLKPAFSAYPVYSLGHTSKTTILRSVARLRKICRAHGVDIIHAHLFWSSLVARLAKPKGVKLVTSIHSILSKDAFEKNKLSLWAEKFTARRQDAVIAVSGYALNDYLQHVPFRGPAHVLYNFIPGEFLAASATRPFPAPGNTLRCVAVGNLKALKNYNYILEGFARLSSLPVSLDIYGEGAIRDQLQKVIDEKQLPARLMGTHTNMREVLTGYDVFIQASLYEGYGIALIEAMAMGLVPALSDIPTHQEVTNGRAFFFDLRDSASLAQTIEQIAAMPATTAAQLQQEMKERASSIAGATVYKQKLTQIYDGLLMPNPATANLT